MTSTRSLRPSRRGTRRTPRARHAGAALVALALGGFAIGTTEFVTMGLLNEIAAGIGESIPRTGHVITAYAFGVVVGAPLIVALGARLPRRELAIGLVLALGLGNALTAMVDGYLPVLLARFVAGLPHGAYFGVASLLAASLVAPERRGRAVSQVMLGLSVATVAGVPAATWLGQQLGWRAAYWAVLGIALVAAALLVAFVPHQPGDPAATVRGELSALTRPQVLFAVAAGTIGFGGVFAMYSYIAPIVTDVTGLADAAIPWFLFAFGVGSVLGTWAAGPLADRDVPRLVTGGFAASIVVLLLFHQTAQWVGPALVGVFVIGLLGSLLAIGLQIRMMDAAGDAKMLGAALNHSALNVANGLGAALGGLVIDAGFGLLAPSLVGASLAFGGLVVFTLGLRAERAAASLG